MKESILEMVMLAREDGAADSGNWTWRHIYGIVKVLVGVEIQLHQFFFKTKVMLVFF